MSETPQDKRLEEMAKTWLGGDSFRFLGRDSHGFYGINALLPLLRQVQREERERCVKDLATATSTVLAHEARLREVEAERNTLRAEVERL